MCLSVVLGIGAGAAGCSAQARPNTATSNTTTPSTTTPSTTTPGAGTPGAGTPGTKGKPCAVTRGSDRRSRPPSEVLRQSPDHGQWFGDGDLWVSLPDPAYRPERVPEGYGMKIGWWRLAEGRLKLSATRIDEDKGSATVDVPSGYAPTGLQPTGVLFSQAGCWRVTGSLGYTKVRFVVAVR
ncbi:hypothetical protein GCM10022226_19280 [Sphaerisporangium flaviroseum]|uniref:Secreted protein n=1 Tax=Sphaerisporangium flaviroseum TaxID=509199 RepID=A0ABP7HS70_9ACTN